MLRFAEDGQAEPVLADGGKPMVFLTELEAQKTVTLHLLRWMNGHMRREGDVAGRAKEEANRIFRKGRMIPVERIVT
ncbi:hypothetical protein EN781_00275 [Mesorhizobium sp. M4A.F.Ca.ET.090.04.2.1]|uniref:hypothetical protein n=1 Tax=Mesorhizobium sp. M4A.F.Ca.ET.090.04.2.1 TaxID=2496663 RepID=UPI000FCC4864|nr:hypothetical protein [Mesorhizobium sp. M4A.F.Ca.ET.090.04.2.1]RVC47607.1 hypothetical protein EN781_00275 [Mesorhizobium sp. M4A.F.Ca.ET.090.04.2.1]